MVDDTNAQPVEPTAASAARTCPWCSAAVAATDTACPSCGAAVAQRDDLGGVQIPGVTDVDPGLAAYAAQPMHLRGPSPTQGVASGVIPAAALGGPAGLAILGGIAAVAAAEYLGARGPNGEALDHTRVGELGGVAQLALDRAGREGSDGIDHTWDVPAPEDGSSPGTGSGPGTDSGPDATEGASS